jgi:hypothetical protein
MSETYSLVRVRRIDYICDRCKEGCMVGTNVANLTHPPQHIHRCDVCGWTAAFTKTYPHVEFHHETAQ